MATRADNFAIDLYRAALAGDETARLLLDASWCVVDCSAAAAELLASTPAALSGVCLRDRFTGPIDDTDTAFDAQLLLGEPGASAAARVRPLRNQGQLIGYALQVTSPRDVRQTRNERRCRALLAMLTTNVWLGTPDGRSADLLDLDAAPTAPAQPLAESLARLHPDDRAGVLAAVEGAVRDGTSFAVEARALAPDGSTRTLAMRGVALRNAAGQTEEWVGASVDVTAERRATAELAEAERRLQLALHASRMGVWEWSPHDGNILLSPEGLEILARQGIRGTPAQIRAMMDPEDVVTNSAKVLAAIADGGHYRGEFRLRRGDGHVMWIATLASVVRDPNRPVRMVGTFHDITEQKAAEQALRASEERLRIALEATGNVTWSLRPDTGRVGIFAMQSDWAPFLREDTFAPLAAPLGVHPEDRAHFAAALRDALQPGAQLDVEGRLQSADGQVRWTVSRGRCMRDSEGSPVLFATTVDLTARRRAELALAQSEQNFARTLEALPIATCVAHRDSGLLTYANTAFLQMFELERAQTIGHTSIELGIWRSSAERAELVEAARHSRRNLECSVPRKDGTTRDVLISAEELQVDGTPCILTWLHDITELKRADHLLRQAQKMDAVGRLAGGVAHDFNNLLSVISMSCCALRAELAPQHPAQARINVVEDALQRGAGLTRQLLSLSRRQITQPVQLDVHETLMRLVNLLRHMLGEDISLTTELSGERLVVTIDPSQFEQVILNIAVNARDAMPSGGRFTIRAATIDLDSADPRANNSARRFVQITLGDTGIGMSEEVKARVFEPFFSTKQPGRGTGLGLAVVHGIITQAGGHVSLTTAVGRGTEVTVLLPGTAPPATPAAAAPNPPASTQAHEHVLVVEDQDDVRRMLGYMLRTLGYRVDEADSGAQALQLIAQGVRPDLLLTDVVMPRMNGRELVESMRAQAPGVRVVYMSGYADDQLVQRGVLDGRELYLQKPFTAADLQAALRRALDQPRPTG